MNGNGKYSAGTKNSLLKPKKEVEFDVTNTEHVEAMMDMILLTKQHSTLRFELKAPFKSVTDMGKMMLACHAANNITGRNFSEQDFLDTVVPETGNPDLDNVFTIRPGIGSGPSKSTH